MKISSAEHVRAAFGDRDFPQDGLPEVTFVGRSNVGKSSLLNRLLGRKSLARTSSTPGRTRSVLYFLVNRCCYFVDLPGYGYARAGRREREKWAELVDRYFRHPAPRGGAGEGQRRLVVHLVDGKVGATPLDLEASDYLRSFGVPTVLVATKIDRVGRARRPAALAAIRRDLGLAEGVEPIAVSAVSGEGIKELWKTIDDHLGNRAIDA